MRLSQTLYLILGLSAGLSSAASVLWPDGYTPTEVENAKASARAAELSTRGNNEGDGLNMLNARDGGATGCVQVHCGAQKGTFAEIWRTYYEYTVWHNGQLIFYLISSTGLFSDNAAQFWYDRRDKNGVFWGFAATGVCGKFEYGNSLQSPPAWRALNMVDKARKKVDKGGGAICRGGKNGDDKCNDATFWENVYSDNAVCGGFGLPAFCDYRGRCVDVNSVPTCQPGQPC